MTLEDLKRQIINLGFETSETYEEEPTIVTDAINLAMREITNVFPLVGEYRIAQAPLPNLLPDGVKNMDAKHYDGKTPLVYAANGARALTFECSGTGTLTLADADGTREVPLLADRAYTEYRMFVNGDVQLSFAGPYSYDVKNIALYGETYSGQIESIPPYRKYIRYDFKELTKENGVVTFIDFMDKVQEGDYAEAYLGIHEFQVEKRHVLVLDGLKAAQYTVFYKKNFTAITSDTPNTQEMELDYDKQHLLPLLASYYVWADDDRTKAAMWRNEYEEYKALLLTREEKTAPIEEIKNVQGW